MIRRAHNDERLGNVLLLVMIAAMTAVLVVTMAEIANANTLVRGKKVCMRVKLRQRRNEDDAQWLNSLIPQ